LSLSLQKIGFGCDVRIGAVRILCTPPPSNLLQRGGRGGIETSCSGVELLLWHKQKAIDKINPTYSK